jgi:hypothetical protein
MEALASVCVNPGTQAARVPVLTADSPNSREDGCWALQHAVVGSWFEGWEVFAQPHAWVGCEELVTHPLQHCHVHEGVDSLQQSEAE